MKKKVGLLPYGESFGGIPASGECLRREVGRKDPLVGTVVRIFLFLALSIVDAIVGSGTYADTRDVPVISLRIERDTQRFRFVATDITMELLDIKAGMTILDIGAGTGQFAFEFSRRLGGTGKVYATDTQTKYIDYIKKEADRRGLGNLYPVLVKKDGFDDFYGKHRYDLITLFHVSMPYEDRVDYFRKLRGCLTEGGRIILIMEKNPAPFTPSSFTGDIRGLIREWSLEPDDSPLIVNLKDSTKQLLRENSDVELSGTVRDGIVADFNKMLSDTRFCLHFLDGWQFGKDVSFSPEERVFADWLLLSFGGRNVFGRDIAKLGPRGVKKIAQINKMLIMQRFRKYLQAEGLFVSGLTPQVKAVFEKAGYRLEHVYTDVIPFEDIIVYLAQ
jgi:SAM-dependent methyltransferase